MNGKLKTAIILGATGLTGSILLELLIADQRYNQIKLFSRSAIGFDHPKITEYLGDLFHLSDFKEEFMGDEVHCCIGTTRAKTPRKEVYHKIDYGIPVAAAALAKENGIGIFLVVSAMGANPRSPIFYNRTKGQMEASVLLQSIPKTYILRPSLIAGKRKEKRMGEWLARQVMKVLHIVLAGPLDKFRSIDPLTIAHCMIWLANNSFENKIIRSDEIRVLGKKYHN